MTSSSTATVLHGYDDLDHLIALQTGDEKHGVAASSTVDVLWVLYDQILRVTPETTDAPERDRFYLSKGHGPMAYYAVLAAKGYFPVEWLADFAGADSPLGHHPDRNLVPGVEISSGSLGHGLPLAVGTALGLRAQGLESRVYCLIGDAELDEGTNAEAIAFAGATGVANLTVVAVDNYSDALGWAGGLETRFEVEGWSTDRVDGRDHAALRDALRRTDSLRPSLVVADIEETA
jgi:transketolase